MLSNELNLDDVLARSPFIITTTTKTRTKLPVNIECNVETIHQVEIVIEIIHRLEAVNSIGYGACARWEAHSELGCWVLLPARESAKAESEQANVFDTCRSSRGVKHRALEPTAVLVVCIAMKV